MLSFAYMTNQEMIRMVIVLLIYVMVVFDKWPVVGKHPLRNILEIAIVGCFFCFGSIFILDLLPEGLQFLLPTATLYWIISKEF
jgi:hypothetical protein